MPLVDAKCTNCGAPLRVDNTKDAAICRYCGSAFIVEKAINNYNITNNNTIHTDVVNIYNGNLEKERLLKNAETYLVLKEYMKAKNEYIEITKKYPDDYRGWWGIYKIPFIMIMNNDADNIGIISTYANENKHHNNSTQFTPLFKDFENAYKLCPDKNIFISFFKKLLNYHELKLHTVESNSHPCYIDIESGKDNSISSELNEFTKWIIYDSSYIFNILKCNDLTFFQNEIVNLFLNALSKKEIPVDTTAEIPECSEKQYYENIRQLLNDNNKLIDGIFAKHGFDTKYDTTFGTTTKSYIKNDLSIETSDQVYFLFRNIMYMHYKHIYSYDSSCYERFNWCYFPVSITKENIYIFNNLCKHCGSKFKGIFKKVCSNPKCGKPKDY